MAKTAVGTYVYCLLAARRRPSLSKVPRGPAGVGRARLLDVAPGLWLVVADAPLDKYGEESINKGLKNLDWVSRAAVAHERVVEAFIGASAIVPMKLFTIFTNDTRALEHLASDRARIDAVVKRVTDHVEWGVRVVLERAAVSRKGMSQRQTRDGAASGAAFLARKKAQRDASIELAARARELVDDLYERLAAQSRLSKRRSAAELPVEGGPLLLDAAFLIPTTRSLKFQKLGARANRDLGRQGYRVSVTGPWPPYSFIQE